MKKLLFALMIISTPAFAQQTATMTWDPVREAIDGSAIAVDGYRVYVSQTSGTYTAAPTVVTAPTHTQRYPIGRYYAVVTAFKGTAESGRSNEVTFDSLQLAPAVPAAFKVTVK